MNLTSILKQCDVIYGRPRSLWKMGETITYFYAFVNPYENAQFVEMPKERMKRI